jgi:hypothetical protein
MKKSEMAQLLTVIAAAYPKFPAINTVMVDIWYEMFKDIDYQVAQVAVKKIILESTFPPSIAELRQTIAEITTPKELKLDAAQAWGEVTRAIKNYGMYREDEAIASMSPRTARVVQMIGWQNICTTEEIDVLRGQFRMMYETTEKREKQDALIPESLRNQIQLMTANSFSKALASGNEIAVTKQIGSGGK